MNFGLERYLPVLRPIMWIIFTLRWDNCIRPMNNSHCAWWCGTSFAIPIIAGLTVARLSTFNQPASTQAAIVEMYDLGVIKTNITAYHEDGVEGVRQL